MKRWHGGLMVLAVWPAMAQAWDPYPSVSNPPPEERNWQAPRPSAASPFSSTAYRAPAAPAPKPAAPPIHYAAPAPAPMPAPTYAPAPVAAPAPIAAPVSTGFIAPAPVLAASPAPAPITYAPPPPAMAAAPVTVPAAPPVSGSPYTATPPSSIYYAPAAAPAPYPDSTAEIGTAPAYAAQSSVSPAEWRIGIEGFYDHYEEPDLMETDSYYGSLTASVDYINARDLYLGLDGRASYGEADYESNGTGTADGIAEQEYELRGKIGYSLMNQGSGWIPYTGLAMRYYMMDGDGEISSTGAAFYDRNIFQVYMPFGAQFAGRSGSWRIRSFLEADLLLYGNVESKLGAIPGFEDANNRQEFGKGGGVRGELMFGQDMAHGGGYEFGPFFRYWSVDDSETDSQAAGTFLEPENDRIQVGAALRYKF